MAQYHILQIAKYLTIVARVQKIDNVVLKRFNRQKVKRKERVIHVSFLIVCEGEKTEPNYFKKFDRKCGNVIFEIICDGQGYNTLRVVEEAMKRKRLNQYFRVWVVIDKDDFPDNSFNAAIQKAQSNDIGCAWSNEAFELWYLMHFQFRNTPMSRDDYKRKIEDELRKNIPDFVYKKNSTEMYDILNKYGNQEQAINYAEKLSQMYNNLNYASHNPRTQVYELVKQLNRKDEILEDEIKKLFE